VFPAWALPLIENGELIIRLADKLLDDAEKALQELVTKH
jgi:exonuclease VII small subunit